MTAASEKSLLSRYMKMKGARVLLCGLGSSCDPIPMPGSPEAPQVGAGAEVWEAVLSSIPPVLCLAAGSSALPRPLVPTTVGFLHPQGLEP